ncbi:hypothetical protein DH2020_041766 [Rehmannia glutinosa]|uniref:Phosphoadenosine phosphosulphate reductase domain-containing protein n=1 Tax=Rehmannia glutinosa TaxID=99300 RepID=A0ABR0URA4_REHGL
MALAVTSSSAVHSSSLSSALVQTRGAQFGTFQPSDRPHLPSTSVNFSRRRCAVKPLNAESKRNDSIVPSAPTLFSPAEVIEKVEVEDYEELAKELENASPLEIMDKALEKFGNDIAIAFSGAEDVALIEYAHLTGRPFRVFSLDTGRLNPETYKFFDEVEKHYGIRIEYMFPDAVEVQALVRSKGLFSFYEDGHQECCRVRKGNDIWNFLRTMNVPVNSLHAKGYISIGCEPCTRPVLPGQHEREGRWWWEDAKAKECGLHKGNIKEGNLNGNGNGAVHANGTEGGLARCAICALVPILPGMEESCVDLAEKLAGSGVKVAKFRADGEEKAFAQRELQLGSFPTLLFFPRHSSRPIKYPSEKRDVESLLAFVNAIQ